MSVRGVLSLCLYHAGDYICEMLFSKDIRMIWIHKLYGNLMLMSHQLDQHDEVWNMPASGIDAPEHLHDEDQQVSQI